MANVSKTKALEGRAIKVPVSKHPDDEGLYFGKTKKRGVVRIKAGEHDYPRGHDPIKSSWTK
jgi:hypothetical protein